MDLSMAFDCCMLMVLIKDLNRLYLYLKLLSAIFYQIFIFSSSDEKYFLFHLKSSFCSRDIQIFGTFSLPFHTIQIQKGKWKWNSL